MDWRRCVLYIAFHMTAKCTHFIGFWLSIQHTSSLKVDQYLCVDANNHNLELVEVCEDELSQRLHIA